LLKFLICGAITWALSRLIFVFFIYWFNNHLLLRVLPFILPLFRHVDNKSRVIVIFYFHWNTVSWSINRLSVSLGLIFGFYIIFFMNALIHFFVNFWIFDFQVDWIIIIFNLRFLYLINEIFFIKIAKIKSLKSIALMIGAVAFHNMNFELLIIFSQRRLIKVSRTFFIIVCGLWILRGIDIFRVDELRLFHILR
jgi:hypothetical protein